MERSRVLVVDERQEHTSAVVSRLRDRVSVETAASYDEALEKLKDDSAGYEIALLNQLTGAPSGRKRRRSTSDRRRSELLGLAQTIRERSPRTDVIFLTFPGAEGTQAAAHAITLEPSCLTPDQVVELVHAAMNQRQQLTVATRGTRRRSLRELRRRQEAVLGGRPLRFLDSIGESVFVSPSRD